MTASNAETFSKLWLKYLLIVDNRSMSDRAEIGSQGSYRFRTTWLHALHTLRAITLALF